MKIPLRSKSNLCRNALKALFLATTLVVLLIQFRLVSWEDHQRKEEVEIKVENVISQWKRKKSQQQDPPREITDSASGDRAIQEFSSRRRNSSSVSTPQWMQEYMRWHTQTKRDLLTPEIWYAKTERRRPKLLILQCLPTNVKCGGLADRIKPLPLLILGAFQTQRLLLIRWRDRPAKLEEFLVPPIHQQELSLDWRLPDWLNEELGMEYQGYSRRHIVNVQSFIRAIHQSSNKEIVTATMQWWDGGEQSYKNTLDLTKNDDEFRRIYHDLFRLCFQPTKPIQQHLDDIYKNTPLGDDDGNPVDYVVAHYRAMWWEDQTPPSWEEQVKTARNAVNCARQLGSQYATTIETSPAVTSKQRPIYFATDSLDAQRIIQDYAVQNPSHHIVVVPHPHLVHLDRVRVVETTTMESRTQEKAQKSLHNNGTTVDISVRTIRSLDEVYPIFVDLFLMANGNCLAYGDGGFGKFGLMLGKNHDCSFQHIRRHKIQKCSYKF